MALATLEQFAVRLDGGVAVDDEPRAQAVLDDVEAEVLDVGDDTWTDETVPAVVLTVIFQAARRGFENPDRVRTERQDTYQYELEDAPGIYLTAEEVRKVKKAAGVSSGFASIEVTHPYGFDGVSDWLLL